MKAHLRRLVVCSLAVVAVAVGYAGDAHAAPPPGVVFGCMNGDWSTSSREGVGSFSSEGECITYVMQGGTVFRLMSWNDTYVSYLGFNEAGSIIAISVTNTSPSTSNPCGAVVYVSIYNDSAFYITYANPGEQSTLYMPTPSPFFLNPDAPHHVHHPDDAVISGNFGMTIGIGPCN